MTAVSENVSFIVLDGIVDKYNSTYHNTINMKPIDVKSNFYVDSNGKRLQSIKIFLLTDKFLIVQKKFL